MEGLDVPREGIDSVSHRQVFREEIRNAIREAIFSGKLNPGDRIIETYWAKELGVSQGPVREAIRDLEAMGLVETVPFKGSRIRTLTEKDVRDNYSVRICLESKSIRDAIIQLDDQRMAELVEHLRTILLEMDDCANRGDLRQFTDCDTLFHRAIIDATGNQVQYAQLVPLLRPDGRDQSAAAPVRPPADFGGHLRPGRQDGHLHAGGPSDRPDGRLHPGRQGLETNW